MVLRSEMSLLVIWKSSLPEVSDTTVMLAYQPSGPTMPLWQQSEHAAFAPARKHQEIQ